MTPLSLHLFSRPARAWVVMAFLTLLGGGRVAAQPAAVPAAGAPAAGVPALDAEGLSAEAFAAAVAEQRKRIRQERAVVQAQVQAAEQDCRSRFFVNGCLREVATWERDALATLRQREVLIDEAERERSRAEALRRTAEKQREHAERLQASDAALAAERERAQARLREEERAEREAQAQARVARQLEREREAAQRRQAREDKARARLQQAPTPPLPRTDVPAASTATAH